MQLKKGEDVVTKDGKGIKTPDEYEEVTESNSRIYKDNLMNLIIKMELMLMKS